MGPLLAVYFLCLYFKWHKEKKTTHVQMTKKRVTLFPGKPLLTLLIPHSHPVKGRPSPSGSLTPHPLTYLQLHAAFQTDDVIRHHLLSRVIASSCSSAAAGLPGAGLTCCLATSLSHLKVCSFKSPRLSTLKATSALLRKAFELTREVWLRS